MQTYRVKTACRVEWNDSIDGLCAVTLKAGDFTPKSEREEAAIRIAVDSDLAAPAAKEQE